MLAQRIPRRDLHVLELRRKQAARLFAKGTVSQASVARELKVSRMSVSRWHRRWKKSGKDALKAALRAGRKPLLRARQLQRLQAALRKGARAHGFSADLWTLPRVATVIERITSVRYHPGHVWKVLGTMNWTVQKPERQAKERNSDQVEYWKTARWRAKKNATRKRAWIFFQDETGFTQQPSIRRTWAPRGETPVLRSRGNHWTKTSVAAALGFRWDGKKTRLFARTKPDSFNTESLIGFLKDLKRFVKGAKVILVWDHLPAHRSKVMKHFLFQQRDWLEIEWLPGYAPDLNPTEAVWNNIKGRELANFCADQIEEAANAFRTGLRRVAHTVQLPFSFLRHAGLFF